MLKGPPQLQPQPPSQVPTKILEFAVPISYEVPHILKKDAPESPQTFAAILDLAAHTYQQLRTKSGEIQNKNLYEELRTQASADYEPRLKKLKQQADEATAVQEVLRHQLAELQQVQAAIRKEERERSRDLLADKDSQIQELRTQARESRESAARILDGFQSLRQDWTKHQAQAQAQAAQQSQNSSIKGKKAEEALAELLLNTFSPSQNGEEFTVAIASKEAYSADIHMQWLGAKLLWESKNYKEQVGTKEVQKFKRDFELNKEMCLGVMVSFHSSIAGHMRSGNLDIESLPDGRFAVYISNLAETQLEPAHILQGVRPFLEILIAHERARRQQQLMASSDDRLTLASASAEAAAATETLRRKQAALEASLGIFTIMSNKHIKNLIESRNRINIWQKKQAQMFAELHADVRENEQYAKQILEEILAATAKLHGEYLPEEKDKYDVLNVQNPIENPVNCLSLDTLVFREDSLDKYDPQEQKFIKDTLKILTVKEDSKTQAKEFKECMRKDYGWTDDSMNLLRMRIFQPGVWDSGSKSLRHLVGLS
jgi:hypothetical protein